MADKQKSKKQVARDYFASLDASVPLRDRVDDLVEYMKVQFVNGQTERVVFNYIREDIPKGAGPDTSGDLFKKILKYKIDQKEDMDSPLWYVDENPAGRVIAILMIVDFYADKIQHHLGEWHSTNKVPFEIEDSKISFGKFDSNEVEWISKYCSGSDFLRNFLPFHSKEQLENPINWDELLEYSKEYLGDSGVEVYNHVMSRGGTYKDALNYLEDEYYWKLDKSDVDVVENANVENSNGVENVDSGQKVAIFLALILFFAVVIYFMVRPDRDGSSTDGAVTGDGVHAVADSPSQRMPAADAKAICDSEMAAQADQIINDCETEDCIKSKVHSAYNSCSSRMGY